MDGVPDINNMEKLVNILSKKFSTTFIIKSKTSDTCFKLANTLKLDQDLNYEIALVYFSTYNSIYNIDDTNNRVTLTIIDGAKKKISKDVKLTHGAYELVDISKVVENELNYDKTLVAALKSLKSLPDVISIENLSQLIKISPNPISTNCILKIAQNCEVTFSENNSLGDFLGFEKNKIYGFGIHYSNKVKITNINRIMIDCNIIEGAYMINDNNLAEQSSIIHDFPANTVSRGRRIIERPKFPIYYPLIRRTIDEIKFKVIDDNNKLINFNNEEIIFTLHLKQV